MKHNEFEEDLKIDIESLEVEACMQPELFFKWSQRAKEGRENSDHAKFQVDIKFAELSRNARSNPGKFGIGKVTNESIKEAVTVHPDYKEIYEEYINAKAEADILYKAMDAMEQRKRMLELLVQLHGREYFAGPLIPRTPGQFWEGIKQKRAATIHDKMVDLAKGITKKKKKKKRRANETNN